MKRRTLVMVAGCLAALVLGLALAYPLLASDMPVTKKLDLTVDVVYAYIGKPDLNENITGLWQNSSNPHGLHPMSYLVILNITNPSDTYAYIQNFELLVSPRIWLPEGSSGVRSTAPILTDNRIRVDIAQMGFDSLLPTNKSRLACLTGFAGVEYYSYDYLNNAPVYVYAKVSGQDVGSRLSHSGYVLKQLDFKESEGNYLYNDLLGENQMLYFSTGLNVAVVARS